MAPGTESQPGTGREPPKGGSAFPATRWSLVVAYQDGDERGALEAMAELCGIYWFPVYHYARSWGRSAEDAEDITQGFLSKLAERDYLGDVSEDRGKLRSYLLVLLKRYMKDERQKEHALKRGGGALHIPVDQQWAEDRVHHEPADQLTPEDIYDRNWALMTLETVLDELQREYIQIGKEKVFDALKEVLVGNALEKSYDEVAGELGLSKNALKLVVFRLRQRYRQLLHLKIADTVASPDEVSAEIDYLCSLFGK